MLRLLCITAHPDDESAGFGGSLLLAHERGIQTFVLCLTPGQAATHRGQSTSDDDLARIRRAEFQEACRHLNVTEGRVLDYPDSKLDRQDYHAVAGELVRHIRELRPHVVLTFGPEGGVTAHPDHSMAGIFTTAAFQWAARNNRYTDQLQSGLQPWHPQKLYYATSDFTLPDRQPVSAAPVTTVIDIGPVNLARKIEAFRKHTTQSPLFELFESHVRPRGTRELFHLAATCRLESLNGQETDLWRGVKDK